MATSFKALNNNDVTRSRTKLHESIPITGSIVSGSVYQETVGGALIPSLNVKNYGHEMFQSVYDYPYLSSSANHIIDVTAGFSANAPIAGATHSVNVVQRNKKNDIYNELSQMLAGYDTTGSINELDVSGNFGGGVSTEKLGGILVLNFARLLTKDEIQKNGSAGAGFSMTLGVSASYQNAFDKTLTIRDKSNNSYRTNSPSGEFNVLYATSSYGVDDLACGLLFYQAGVVVLTASVFQDEFIDSCQMNSSGQLMDDMLVSGSITASCDGFRHRIGEISFNNTTELNSTVYFCRANNSEFNLSSNPTYLSSSQIRVKEVSTDNPVSYVTTVGLYSEDNALLAVSKLSEPLKKAPDSELTLRVRLDY
mgnify:CR=1 FL=1|tara:strand:+ start:1119 stop:2216 length:1098 start_codon:yes stop_codon:yes gene_type:complete